MNTHKPRNLRLPLLVITAAVCVQVAYSQGMESAPRVTVWVVLILIAIATFFGLIYLLKSVRRFRLRTLMFLIPIPAALLAIVTTPYFRHRQIVQQFKRAGIEEFSLEAVGFEKTLETQAHYLTGTFPNIFGTKWKSAYIDVDNCKSEHLREISGHPEFIFVGYRDGDRNLLSDALIDWINSLPLDTHVTMGMRCTDADIPSLNKLKRPVQFSLSIPSSPEQLDFLWAVESNHLLLFDDSAYRYPPGSRATSGGGPGILEPSFYQSADTPASIGHARALSLTCQAVDTAWLVDLCDRKTIVKLNQYESTVFSFNHADCARLAKLPNLNHVKLVGLDRDRLLEIADSKHIRHAYFHNCKLSEDEIVEVQAAFKANSIQGELIFPAKVGAKPRRVKF